MNTKAEGKRSKHEGTQRDAKEEKWGENKAQEKAQNTKGHKGTRRETLKKSCVQLWAGRG